MTTPISYLPQITALRALAVISVVIFHLFPEYLPGGFSGVDIFFVISGYLITSILYQKTKLDIYYFNEFIINRLNRLVPALYFITMTTSIMAFIFFMPIDLRKFSD